MKRSYQVQSKYTLGSKRARTLNNEVQRLKKQVRVNSKELKYFEVVSTPDSASVQTISLFGHTGNTAGKHYGSDRELFVGRKFRVKKIEMFVHFDNPAPLLSDTINVYRETRPGKALSGNLWPLAFDPEYHTPLRTFKSVENAHSKVRYAVINFGPNGRVVELDGPDDSDVITPTFTKGDIRLQYILGTSTWSARVWYTDD